uniref:Epidermal retinol dehydrogenase 2 n=1 Tax=Phallusia mammillata TaxID=59560 RepID=A0A6F9DR53_9ASCI|nr:epidermal retinol dehydrogenase 2 [Phallusia mammillata]
MGEFTVVSFFTGMFWAMVYWVVAIFQFFVPPPRKDVSGKIVLITGAGSGIGQKLSIEFAKLGCSVVGWDISTDGLSKTGSLMSDERMTSQWHPYKCDITDRHRVYEVAEKVQEDVGCVDILINNAGIVTGKKFLDCRDEMIIKTMEVNTIAHFWTLKAFLPGMIDRDSGHVVTVASGAGLFGMPGQCDYAASKFAAVGLTEALYCELEYSKSTGVKTTVVCPYYIDTGMFKGVETPLLPMIKSDDAVNQIVDAVLRNKTMLLMPRIVYFLYYLKGLMPAKTAFLTGNASGTMASMDTFRGRVD